MFVSKTHKNRRVNRNELWTKLESLIAEDQPDITATVTSTAASTATSTATATATAAKSSGMECVYNPSGNREVCDVCHSNLVITEEGFATCTNSKCSIIYKDSLDYSAEWRFYGADDNQMTDPTRCGMPVSPTAIERKAEA